MPQRRFSLTDLFLFVAFCALVLAFVVPLVRQGVGYGNFVEEIAFSADGSTVAALFGDGKVRAWRASDQSLLASFDSGGGVTKGRIAISSDGRLAAVFTGYDPSRNRPGEIGIWDLSGARKIAAVAPLWHASLAFSPTDALLAVGNQDSSIDLYRCIEDGPPKLVRTLDGGDEAKSPGGGYPPIAFSADGKTLAAQYSTAVWFWNVETGERGNTFEIGQVLSDVHSALSSDGKYLASSGFDLDYAASELRYELHAWNVATSKKLVPPPQSQERSYAFDGSNSLAFLPDGRTLVSAGYTLRAWDLESRKDHALASDLNAQPTMLAAPRQGNRFAVADLQTITLWDATTLQPRESLWTSLAGGPSFMLLIAAVVLFTVWGVRRSKKLARQCATCGQAYYLANAKDTQTECPHCRFAALPDAVRAKKQAKDRRKGWFSLAFIGFSLLLLLLVGGIRPILLIAGSGIIVIPAIIGGLFAWLHLRARRLSRENKIVELIERHAGAPAEVLLSGPVMVWCGEGTTLGREVESQLVICADRIRTMTGQSLSAGPWLRCFVLGSREQFEQAAKSFGLVLGKGSHYDSCYFGSPMCVALLEEDADGRKTPEPLGSVRSALTFHLIESLDDSFRTTWLNRGLSYVVAHAGNSERFARLNRRVLADIAARRVLDAKAFFARLPRIVLRFKLPTERDFAAVANEAAREAQYHSFMEFLCGAGATHERRRAFQNFLADPRRRKRQEEAIVVHFGCSPERLLEEWRAWVEQVGVGEHAAPTEEYAALLASGPIATIENDEAAPIERIRAIRRLAREGFAVGAEELVGIVRRGPEELVPEAIWALEAISGRPLGGDVAAWEAWLDGLPAEAVGRHARLQPPANCVGSEPPIQPG